jgi:hypothetical protein
MSGKRPQGLNKPRGRFDFLAQTSFALFSQKTKEMSTLKIKSPTSRKGREKWGTQLYSYS